MNDDTGQTAWLRWLYSRPVTSTPAMTDPAADDLGVDAVIQTG
jgi:hypothetical protein